MTERRLARLSGVSQPHIHNVLKGKRVLSLDMADQVLRGLKLDLLDLIDPSEYPRSHMSPWGEIREIPVLEGYLGPGHHFHFTESYQERVPFRALEVDRLQGPVVARLAEDPQMMWLFQEDDLALLDRSESRRRHPVHGGYYVVRLTHGACVRRLLLSGGEWYAASEGWAALPGQEYISVHDRHILDIVMAMVIWIGRHLEPFPFDTR